MIVPHQQAIAIVDTNSWRVTGWVRPPISATGVGYGDADHPGQVVFNRNATRAYVTCFNTDRVAVFNASNKSYLTSIDLELPHNGTDSALNTPYSMVAVDDSVFVVSQLSGNQTVPVGELQE